MTDPIFAATCDLVGKVTEIAHVAKMDPLVQSSAYAET